MQDLTSPRNARLRVARVVADEAALEILIGRVNNFLGTSEAVIVENPLPRGLSREQYLAMRSQDGIPNREQLDGLPAGSDDFQVLTAVVSSGGDNYFVDVVLYPPKPDPYRIGEETDSLAERIRVGGSLMFLYECSTGAPVLAPHADRSRAAAATIALD